MENLSRIHKKEDLKHQFCDMCVSFEHQVYLTRGVTFQAPKIFFLNWQHIEDEFDDVDSTVIKKYKFAKSRLKTLVTLFVNT
jgi:hypothetical protein